MSSRVSLAGLGEKALIDLTGIDIQIGHSLGLSWRERHQTEHCGKRNSLHELLLISSPPNHRSLSVWLDTKLNQPFNDSAFAQSHSCSSVRMIQELRTSNIGQS